MFRIEEEILSPDVLCEWYTFKVGTVCSNRPTKVIIEDQAAQDYNFHTAHLCEKHITKAYELVTTNQDKGVEFCNIQRA
jgi:hypothetical protein